ncbi:hypothetical protein MD588_05370 [Photobacterium sp. SDRW27]|uniref:hypothetical protein n=1 Tax=Photobacterium obscurum TaxID=2829490 RepID=UPI002244DC6F|nr:hypothetical protein [Photobacterium obscurum]MCW8328233.1 hypothetical protein [Photobacterium obscurum]
MNFFYTLFKLNIVDYNFDLSSEEIKQVERLNSGKFGLLEGLARYFYNLLKSLVFLQFNCCKHTNKVVFFAGSKNQFIPLEKLNKKIDETKFIYHGSYSDYKFFSNAEFFSYFISLFFLPIYIYRYLKTSSSYQRKMMRCRFDRYIHTYGLFCLYGFSFKGSRTKYVFFSNDHTVWTRVANSVCRLNGIETVYIQHANVSKTFPKLEFDYAFLDGEYSESVYERQKYTKVYKVGCLRFEGEISLTKPEDKLNTILCFNRLDSEEFIVSLCGKILEKVGLQIVGFRLHPADRRVHLAKKLESMGLKNETKGSSISSLSKYKFCFAGNSSVFLDASIAGCKSISYEGWFGTEDYYSFKKNGIVNVFCDLNLLLSYLGQIDDSSIEVSSIYNSVDPELICCQYPSERIMKVLKL